MMLFSDSDSFRYILYSAHIQLTADQDNIEQHYPHSLEQGITAIKEPATLRNQSQIMKQGGHMVIT